MWWGKDVYGRYGCRDHDHGLSIKKKRKLKFEDFAGKKDVLGH